VDTIELGRGFARDSEDWSDWILPDGTPCKIPAFIHPVRENNNWNIYHEDGTLIATQKEDCLYVEQTCFPLAGSSDSSFDDLEVPFEKVMWAALGSPPAPIGYDSEGLRKLAEGAKGLHTETDRAIIGLFGGNLLENSQFLFGMANFLMMLAGEPKRVHRLLDRLVEMHLDNLGKYLSAVGSYIDIILFGDDLGMQTGPQISPRMFHEYLQPRYKIMWDAAKKLSDAKIMLHSCGGIEPLLPGLIEAGLDIVQPVQTTSKGMEPERLKQEYGRDICFWGGGCDTREVLPWGTPEDVASDVRKRVGILSPGGGYVFQQVHNIMADVPPQNIVAMLEAVNS
jgi:uroporphyrinogen decarboxylase